MKPAWTKGSTIKFEANSFSGGVMLRMIVLHAFVLAIRENALNPFVDERCLI